MPNVIQTIRPIGWTPDLGVFNNPGWVRCENVFPIGVDDIAQPKGIKNLGSITGTCIGAACHPDIAASNAFYYGTSTKLYHFAVGTATATDRSGAVYAATKWRGIPFGGDLLMVGGTGQRPQYRDADAGAGNFADLLDATSLGNNDIKPKFIATIGQRILVANLVDATAGTTLPSRVWWSATNNARRFGTAATDPTLRTGYQDLYDDYGDITGLSGATDYALIFKSGIIYRMDFGGPFDFTFKPVALGTGTLSQESIVSVEGDVYYWSSGGPAVIRQGSQYESLANTALSRTLNAYGDLTNFGLSTVNVDPSTTIGWFCPWSRTVCWTYSAWNQSESAYTVSTAVFHIDSGRWSLHRTVPGETQCEAVVTYPYNGTTKYGWEFGGQQIFLVNGTAYDLTGFTTDNGVTASNVITMTTGVIVISETLGANRTPAKIVRIRPRAKASGTLAFGFSVVSYDDLYNLTTVSTDIGVGPDLAGFWSIESPYAQAFAITMVASNASGDYSRIYEMDSLDVEFMFGGQE